MPGIGWGRARLKRVSPASGRCRSGGGWGERCAERAGAVAFVIPKESDSLEDRDVAHRKRRRLWRWWTARLATLAARARLVCLAIAKNAIRKNAAPTIQAICEGRDPGDLTTIDDPRRWIRSARRWKSRLLSDASPVHPALCADA